MSALLFVAARLPLPELSWWTWLGIATAFSIALTIVVVRFFNNN